MAATSAKGISLRSRRANIHGLPMAAPPRITPATPLGGGEEEAAKYCFGPGVDARRGDEFRIAHGRAQFAADGAEGQIGIARHRSQDGVAVNGNIANDKI